MKFQCETGVLNRLSQGTKGRTVKSTIAVGYKNGPIGANGKRDVEVTLFTQQNKAGVRYTVNGNIKNIYTKFLHEGRITVSFRQPAEDLMIKADTIQLRGFLKALKMGLLGKDDALLRLSLPGMRPRQQLRMVINKRVEYPLKGFPKCLEMLCINNINLIKLSAEVVALKNLTTLDLSCNQLAKIPTELGDLKLKSLNLKTNWLGYTYDWEWLKGKAITKSLRELDLTDNKLQFFPPQLVKYENLVVLKLEKNSIKKLPFGIRRMQKLRYLHICANLIESLPSSFNHIRLDMLDVWGNNFKLKMRHNLKDLSLAPYNSAQPLWLQAARHVIKSKAPLTAGSMPLGLINELKEGPVCACGKLCTGFPIFEKAIRVKFINTKNLIFGEEHSIFTDEVLCGRNCLGCRQINFISEI